MIPTSTLPNGAVLAKLGYGTGTVWIKESEDEIDGKVVEAYKEAIALGYRHLDCAQYYRTEAELGVALQECGVPRNEFFITTKAVSPHGVEDALKASLKKLQLDYVDLYLHHEPFSSGGSEETLQTAWRGMENCVAHGLAKNIGVSHFRQHDLKTILKVATIKPAVNQLEVHPYLPRTELRAYLQQQGIAVHAFAALTPLTASRDGPVDAVVQRIAEKHGATASTVLLRWILDQEMVVITTSRQSERLKEYLGKTWECELTQAEVDEITEAGKGRRYRGFMADGYGASNFD